MVRKQLVEIIEKPKFADIRLKHLFKFSVEDAILFLANASLLKNNMKCSICASDMNIQKRSDLQDGIQWVCRNNKVQCSNKSIRSESFFGKSKLPLPISILVFYMWANDFDNKQIARELDLSAKTVVDWLNMCREVCENYCHNQEQLGGEGRYIEIDESCITKQKHHRGRPRRGTTQWVFGGIERGEEGLAFAFRVKDRTKKTLYPLIRDHILPRTTIISDDWPAYRKIGKKLGRPMGYKHYIICHKTTFARSIVENGIPLRVHTNKSEGFWAHMKHKIKRLYGPISSTSHIGTNGRFLVRASNAGRLLVEELLTGKLIAQIQLQDKVGAVRFADDRQNGEKACYLAAASINGQYVCEINGGGHKLKSIKNDEKTSKIKWIAEKAEFVSISNGKCVNYFKLTN